MNPESFFENFSLLAETPNGIQKLREMILQMAVQGKLVPQNPEDEPAEVLLEKIRKEKKIKKSKESSELEEIDVPFDIPVNWKWSLLDDISDKIHYGYTASADENIKGVKLLRITDIQNNKVNWDTVPGCQIENEKIGSYSLSNGDLLIARTGGTIGKSYLVENINVCSVFASYLIRIVPSSFILPRYLKVFTESPLYWKQLYSKCSGTGQPNVNGTALRSLVTPIPPLEEQKRIAAKVDQLMELCNQLESLQQKKHESRIHLNNAVLYRMLDASSPEEFVEHWRLVCDNFGLLYDNLENVEKSRQAILQLAVMGKLVEQDAEDEPADVLLENIKAEKTKLTKEGKIKKSKSVPKPSLDSLSFDLPKGWLYVAIDEISSLVTDGEHNTPQRINEKVIPLVTAKNVRDGFLDLNNTDYVSNETAEKCWNRCSPTHNDILMVCVGATTGRLCLLKEPPKFTLVRSVSLIRPFERHIYPEFVATALKSPLLQNQIWGNVKQSAQPCLYINKIKRLNLPFPPLEEQKRIVAKVDQLMELCDRLEDGIRQAQEDGERLMEAMVSNLLTV